MIRVVNVTASNLRKLGIAPEQVCYVGRAVADWPLSPWGNPFKSRSSRGNIDRTLARYRIWLNHRPHLLDALWEACEHGAKPLGCWCVDAEHGDGQAVVCHAQILAEELHKRFVEGNP